jgi:pimeloyl-ACP methyl ester carboxylesterase
VPAAWPGTGTVSSTDCTSEGRCQAARCRADTHRRALSEFFHDVPQSATPFAEPWPLDAWPDVPTRVLISRDDRFFPAEFQRRVARERLGITPDEMPGGHLVALSQPTELTDRLEAYATDLAR